MTTLVSSRSIRLRVQPISLPKVKDEHLLGVFGHFSDVVESRIKALKATGIPINLEKARFFEYLLIQVDAERYGELQENYLASIDPATDLAKYIDPIIWFES